MVGALRRGSTLHGEKVRFRGFRLSPPRPRPPISCIRSSFVQLYVEVPAVDSISHGDPLSGPNKRVKFASGLVTQNEKERELFFQNSSSLGVLVIFSFSHTFPTTTKRHDDEDDDAAASFSLCCVSLALAALTE